MIRRLIRHIRIQRRLRKSILAEIRNADGTVVRRLVSLKEGNDGIQNKKAE